MKTYLVLPHQYVASSVHGQRLNTVRTNDAIIPKKIVEENNNHILQQVTYRDVLMSVDSEFDVITTSNKNVSMSIIVNDDREIQLSMKCFSGKIAYLEDDTVNSLGYKSVKLTTKEGIKIVNYTSNGEYYVFSNHVSSLIISKKDALVSMCKELIDNKYANSIRISIGMKSHNWYTVTKDNIEEVATELETTKKRVEVYGIEFNKVFTRNEANDVLRIITQCIDLPNLLIQRADLEDLYTLV